MRLMLDISKASFEVSTNPVPKLDDTGKQRFDRESNLPMWSVEIVALDAKGAQVLNVTVVNEVKPPVTVKQAVIPVGLEARPWMNKGRDGTPRHGVAFTATDLKVPVGAGK